MSNVSHGINAAEAVDIQKNSIGFLQEIQNRCGNHWKSVICDMYVRVIADSYGNEPDAELKKHNKSVMVSVKELIEKVKKIKEIPNSI